MNTQTLSEVTDVEATSEVAAAPSKPAARFEDDLTQAAVKVLGHSRFEDILQVSRRGGLALICDQGELKVFKLIGCQADWKKRWARHVGWNPARRAYRMSAALAACEIPVCPIERHGNVGLPNAPRAVWTISHFVGNAHTMRHVKESLQPGVRRATHPQVKKLFADALQLLRRIHDAGFEHRDYHAGNLLVVSRDESNELHLVDLETVVRRRATVLRRARDIKRFLENFVDPEIYLEVIDEALLIYAPDEPDLRSAIRSTQRMKSLVEKRGVRRLKPPRHLR